MCSAHYNRVLRYGDPNFIKKVVKYPDNQKCKIDRCNKKVQVKNLCF